MGFAVMMVSLHLLLTNLMLDPDESMVPPPNQNNDTNQGTPFRWYQFDSLAAADVCYVGLHDVTLCVCYCSKCESVFLTRSIRGSAMYCMIFVCVCRLSKRICTKWDNIF